jgi:hypothetical protein
LTWQSLLQYSINLHRLQRFNRVFSKNISQPAQGMRSGSGGEGDSVIDWKMPRRMSTRHPLEAQL